MLLTPNIKRLISGLWGALVLEDIFPHKARRLMLQLFGSLSLILIVFMILFGAESADVRGGFLLLASVSLVLLCLEAYFYSMFRRASIGKFKLSFEMAKLVFYADDADLVRSLIYSETGDEVMRRLGFSEEEIRTYLTSRVEVSFEKSLETPNENLGVLKYAHILWQSDSSFETALKSKGLSEKDLAGALRWVTSRDWRHIEHERWWSRESLGRIPGIGKNWAYGETFIIDRYGVDITSTAEPFDESYAKVHEPALRRLESVLIRSHGADAIVVSDDEGSRIDVVTMLGSWIKQGKAMPALEHKRVYLLNPNLIVESSGDKISFECDLTQMLVQAIKAGNVILVIPSFSAFIQSANNLGVDVVAVMAPYIASSALHIVALDSKSAFDDDLSLKSTIATHFEMIEVGSGGSEGIVMMLETTLEPIEYHTKVMTTYPALTAIAEGAQRFFDSSSAPEKAKDMLLDALGDAEGKGARIITKDDVLSVLEVKTGVPVAVPKGRERQTLLHLEELLHQRVVGQDEAVRAVSEALKRSRAGVGDTNKPIGTFLFLGPTGVGKTETTKALSDIFFGSEDRISRLDMSEFRDHQAIERLIGSFESGKSGRLANVLMDRPYGVLLLDEFEKTTPEVMNIFLRLFDEGILTDANGRKLNGRNNIMIATSNAGSELVWDIVKSGGTLQDKKAEIIDSIVKSGVFKPELLNRFDAVVLFSPLLSDNLIEITSIMVKRFVNRMSEKGVNIKVAPGAIEYLADKGTDPKFGARPINRAIADELERRVAEGIISGEIVPGSNVEFDQDARGMLQMIVKR